MIKVFYLLIACILLYIAGIFESDALLFFVGIQLIFALVSFLSSLYLKKKLQVHASNTRLSLRETESLHLPFEIVNPTIFPVFRFKAVLIFQYENDLNKRKERIKFQAMKKKTQLPLEWKLDSCGKLNVIVQSLSFWDASGLFCRKIKPNLQYEIAVLPKQIPSFIEGALYSKEQGDSMQMKSFDQGEINFEIRDLRPYQDQDHLHQIHWNQSARMDELWVKEFEKEIGSQLSIYVDLMELRQKDHMIQSHFYQSLYSLLMGQIERQGSVALQGTGHVRFQYVLSSLIDLDVCFQEILFEQEQGDTTHLAPVDLILDENGQLTDAKGNPWEDRAHA